MPTTTLSAADLARRTPTSRDRYVDFLRLASIVVVVLGHWLMAVVTWRGDDFRTGNVIAMVPGLWAATWLLQVMPIFFFVGGFSNLVTIDAHRRRGAGATEFVAGRVRRLVRPVALLLAIWLPVAFVIRGLGFSTPVVHAATKLVCQPLWFIGVYLVVTALAPTMRSLHARHRIGTLIGLAVAIAIVDVVRFGFGIAAVGFGNVLFVWLLAQQLGFFYADGTLLRVGRGVFVATGLAALGALAVLTTCGPYPSSMVGLPGERVSNMSPPTVCLAVLTIFQVALVMLARPAVQRWLERRRVWTAVVAGNGVIMTVFLWHLTALLLAITALHQVGFVQARGGSTLWWLTRPVVFGLALVPLALAIRLLGSCERPDRANYCAHGPAPALTVGAGVTLLAFAVLGVASSNLADLLAGTPVHLAVLTVTPLALALGAAAGWALVHRAARPQPITAAR